MLSYLYTVLISPIELIIEIPFVFFYKIFENTGVAIAAISILVSLLSLPLYHKADQLQKKERDARLALNPGITRIKSVFKGDEQYMMLSTFYRQQQYHPVFALRSSISLLIQVPFFIAAYNFLSHLSLLQGESFLFIKDLGKSDNLITIGSVSINALPIVMTLINIIAGVIYSKGFPLRDKIQLYGVAGLFLILLYQSPAGLVYYWTLNNIFSLVKNIFYKLKHPLKILYGLTAVSVTILTLVILSRQHMFSLERKTIIVLASACVIAIPLFLKIIQKIQERYLSELGNNKSGLTIFLLSIGLLWVVLGFVVPSTLIASSPEEFSFIGSIDNPLQYVANTALFFFGLIVLWPILLFFLANKSIQKILCAGSFILSIVALSNLILFPGNYDSISRVLTFEESNVLDANLLMTIVPILVAVIILLGTLFIMKKNRFKILTSILTIMILATSSMSVYAIAQIQNNFTTYKENVDAYNSSITETADILEPVFTLHRDGKNVVVLFLDRAISSFLPIIIDQFPFLKEQYSGFTYYPNTISFGSRTILGAPGLMGGYEYTPDAMNKRDAVSLVDKHNESLLLMPRIFSEAGYDVSVFDPSFTNHTLSEDFSIYQDNPDIQVSLLKGKYSERYRSDHPEYNLLGPDYESNTIRKRLPMFSLLRTIFPVLRTHVYLKGTYFLVNEDTPIIPSFLHWYATLHYLPQLTEVVSSSENSFNFIVNETTHQPNFLEAPDYRPVAHLTNTYSPIDREAGYSENDIKHYHVNTASILRIGTWLDTLKEQGVYDNTRIIIVADHGRNITTPVFKNFSNHVTDLGYFNPLLLVKDFDAHADLRVDNKLMTNADTPTLAIQDLPIPSVNPFTGNDLFEAIQKDTMHVYHGSWDPKDHRKNTLIFWPGSFSIQDSIFEESNWNLIQDL